MKPARRRAALAITGALAVACAGPRPVLYPNARYEDDSALAQVEIDRCIERSKTVAESGGRKAGRVAGQTATGAAVGGATGAVVGAIAGSPGTGAAIGAAGSATATLMRGVFGARELDAVQRGFVERCLRERGYDPIAWR